MYRTITALIPAALAAMALSLASGAAASPAPNDGGPSSASFDRSGGRTDQQFWGQATWDDPLSGLNLDRTPGH